MIRGRNRGRGWRRGRWGGRSFRWRRSWRRRRYDVAHRDKLLVRNPFDISAHRFRKDANRHEDLALPNDRGDVEWAGVAVHRDFRFTDRDLHVGARFAYVNGLGAW